MKRIISIITVILVCFAATGLFSEEAILFKKKPVTKSSKQNSKSTITKKKISSTVSRDKLKKSISNLVDSVVRDIPANGKKTRVIIPNFDRINDDRSQRNFNYAFLDMLSSRISGKKSYQVLERDAVDEILDTLDLDTRGLYGSKKEAALGKMVDADYIIIGQLKMSADESREYIKIKVIDVKGGGILSEKKTQFDRLTFGEASRDFLIEKDSYEYIPPYLRFTAGMEYYQHVTTTHFKNKAGDLGFNLGVVFDLNKTHSFQVLTNVIFNMAGMFEYDNRDIDIPGEDIKDKVISAVDFTTTIEYQMGYGYIFKPFRMVYIRPSIFLGYNYTQYNFKHLYLQEPVAGIGSDEDSMTVQYKGEGWRVPPRT